MAIRGEPKQDVLTRLSRVEGQVRGIKRLVEEDTYCVDVMQQIASVHQALRGVEKLLMQHHLEHCVTEALRGGDGGEARRTYGEMMDLIYKYCR